MENNDRTQGGGSVMSTSAVLPPESQWHNQITGESAANLFKPNVTDFIFALVAFVLGYVFVRWVLFTGRGWGVSAFTTVYLLTSALYLIKKGAFVKRREAIFWMAVTWLTGLSYALWENEGISSIRMFFMFCAAVYYVIVATGTTLLGKTSNFLILDGIRAVIILPFRNFINQYVSFSVIAKGERKGKFLPVFIGITVALILAAIIIPLLERADAGGFGMIMNFFRSAFWFDYHVSIYYIILSVPVAAYLYGLISGAVHKKGTDFISPEGATNTVKAMRVIQPTTINIVLGAVCVLYLVFIFSQLPYFFSAFTGVKPEGWRAYSEFARHGFFELCWIAAINLAILTVGNICNKKLRMESKVLRVFNIVLALITLVLIATAFSKMALYIGAFGLTMRRLLPCVFMVFIAVVFVALIALQKWDFSIVRFSAIVGAVIIVGLCFSNPDAMVVRYNTNRYLSGTLRNFDTEVLWRSGAAGVLPAIEVYNNSSLNENRRQQLRWYISSHYSLWGGSNRISLEFYRASQAARAGGFRVPAPTSMW